MDVCGGGRCLETSPLRSRQIQGSRQGTKTGDSAMQRLLAPVLTALRQGTTPMLSQMRVNNSKPCCHAVLAKHSAAVAVNLAMGWMLAKQSVFLA